MIDVWHLQTIALAGIAFTTVTCSQGRHHLVLAFRLPDKSHATRDRLLPYEMVRGIAPEPWAPGGFMLSDGTVSELWRAGSSPGMCSKYKPVTLQDRLLAHFGVVRPDDASRPETYVGFASPFIIRDDHKAELPAQCVVGQFGLVPEWAADLGYGRKTYNCRTETMRTKASFKEARFSGRRCVVSVQPSHVDIGRRALLTPYLSQVLGTFEAADAAIEREALVAQRLLDASMEGRRR